MALNTISRSALSLQQLRAANWAPLVNAIGNASVVMIGEATHGTKDFYEIRAEISQALIEHHGFSFVAVEGDYPDIARVNKYVRGKSRDNSAENALGSFTRFPRWMWRNKTMVNFVNWMRNYNEKLQTADPKRLPAGLYGLDMYSLYTSAQAVISYYEKVDPKSAEICRDRYAAFSQFRSDIHQYPFSVMTGEVEKQRANCVQVLIDLMKKEFEYIKKDGDEFFDSIENARLVRDAEEYYRRSFEGGTLTWNLRDAHFYFVLEEILRYRLNRSKGIVATGQTGQLAGEAKSGFKDGTTLLSLKENVITEKLLKENTEKKAPVVRGIVWAHNSHVGDSSATSYGRGGPIHEFNIGELCRRKMGLPNTFNIGFTTFNGTVSAAKRWDGKRETMTVNDAITDSYERLFHEVSRQRTSGPPDTGSHSSSSSASTRVEAPPPATPRVQDPNFALLLRSNNPDTIAPNQEVLEVLKESRYERAIGVQYVKVSEFQSHYMDCVLPNQFDFVIHVDQTRALEPLDE